MAKPYWTGLVALFLPLSITTHMLCCKTLVYLNVGAALNFTEITLWNSVYELYYIS